MILREFPTAGGINIQINPAAIATVEPGPKFNQSYITLVSGRTITIARPVDRVLITLDPEALAELEGAE